MRSAAPSRQLPVVEYLHHGIYLGRAGGAQASCEDEPVVAELRRNGLVDTISLAEFADGRPVYMDAAAPDAAACARAEATCAPRQLIAPFAPPPWNQRESPSYSATWRKAVKTSRNTGLGSRS